MGDVVGHPGLEALRHGLTRVNRDEELDFIVVNAENIAEGAGITPELCKKVIEAGADVVTLGDHLYRRREIIPTLEKEPRLIRPANLAPTAPGAPWARVSTRGGVPVAVISLLGRLFMKLQSDCPFRAVNAILASLPKEIRVILVDFHAEATSEKVAMGWHLDGRASVVFGTHTHVPTADERILPGGTAFISDVGMTGPYDSILGRRKDRVLTAMVEGIPQAFTVADGDVRMCGIVASINPATGRALAVRRVNLPLPTR